MRQLTAERIARMRSNANEYGEAYTVGGQLLLAILGLAERGLTAQWHSMDSAPRGRRIIVYAPAAHGLPSMASICEWHHDAGFCIDELRNPILWLPLPAEEPDA
jgi:hypothetical protein